MWRGMDSWPQAEASPIGSSIHTPRVLWAQPSHYSPLFLDGTSHWQTQETPVFIFLYLAALFDWTFPWDIYVETKENTPGSFLISANPS